MKDYSADLKGMQGGGEIIDNLAKKQNVKSLKDVRVIFGTWPDKEDDGFEEAINELRYGDMANREENHEN